MIDLPTLRPDRWFDLEGDKHAPPLKTWSFMMGPRTCPGWRYAQVQVMWYVPYSSTLIATVTTGG